MNVLTFIIDLLCKKQIYVPLVSITIGLFSYKVIKKALSNLTKNVKDSYEKEVYDEIWNTILSKNGNITVGYTKENRKEMKERFKK